MNEDRFEDGDFLAAIERFTEAITLNRNNFQLFCQRSAAYARIGRHNEALEDAKRCHELKPDYAKAYHRMGVAYQGLGQYDESLVSFSEGLAIDPKLSSALVGLIDSMLKSPYKGNFQQKLEKLPTKVHHNPFIMTSAVGQELSSAGKYSAAVKVLEAARNIGTESPRLQSSLLQALGQVYWILEDTDKSLEYMLSTLKLAESMGDDTATIRAHDNLGVALSSVGRHDEAIKHHSQQLALTQARNAPYEILNSFMRIGSTFSKIGSHSEALGAFKEAFVISKELSDEDLISQTITSIADTYLILGDIDPAIGWYHEQLKFAKELKNKPKEAEAYSHLGHSCYLKGNYEQSMMYYQQLLTVAVHTNDLKIKAEAYGGMGQASRAMNSLNHALSCREQQLKISEELGDEETQLVALTHIGHIHRAGNKLSSAIQNYNKSLAVAQKTGDQGGEAKAYSSLGLCHTSLGNIREAVKYYEMELKILEERDDKHSQVATHGQLGLAYLSLESQDQALSHLSLSLKLAKELADRRLECQSSYNLGHYFTVIKDFTQGLSYLDGSLKLSQELKYSGIESKSCHDLGLCHEGLGHHKQAIQYFQHDFMAAKETQDKDGMTKACEKLATAYSEIGDKEQSEVYQKKLSAIAEDIQSVAGKCSFWNQMADESLAMGDYDKAIEYYSNLLKEAKKEQHQSFEGVAYRGLGNAHLSTGNYDHALSYFRHDLSLRKSSGDLLGECDAYFNMGTTHNSLNQHSLALESFEHQLTLARQLDNGPLITKAYGCLGIVHRNTKNFTNALHYHQLQLTTALTLQDNLLEQAGAYANLGDSFEAVHNYIEATRNHEKHLSLAKKLQSELLQIRALGSLGRAYRGLGSLRKSLSYFQQRLQISKDINDEYIEAESYADIGNIHMLLKDYQQALDSYSKQLRISKTLEDIFSEALASCGLGEVHFRLGNYGDAIDHHMYDLQLCIDNNILDGEARALGNIADTYEGMREYQKAVHYREKQLSVADTLRDPYIRAVAFMGLGKTYLRIGDFNQSVSLLKQALGLTVKPNGYTYDETETDKEVEAKIRFYLGQAFYHIDHNSDAMACLQKALPLFEHLRGHVRHYDHSIKQTLELLPILYQTLICVLVRLNKVEEALEMAERERNRALVDALIDRDISTPSMSSCGLLKPFSPNSSWIQDAISTIRCPVLYYAVALNHVFLWLLLPKSGIVQFKHVNITELSSNGTGNLDNVSMFSENSLTYVQPLVETIGSLRELLGVEPRRQSSKSANSSVISDDSLDDNESLISGGGEHVPTFSIISSSTPSTMSSGSVSSSPSKIINMQPINDLYDLLIHPVECALPRPPPGSAYRGQVIIVPDKDLYLVPFSLLKPEGKGEFLFQQFHIRYAPSLQSLVIERKMKIPLKKKSGSTKPNTRSSPSRGGVATDSHLQVPNSSSKIPLVRSHSPAADPLSQDPLLPHKPIHLVVGNPSIPINASQSSWQPMVGAEKETKRIADLLEATPLTGTQASKPDVLDKLSDAHSIYFATNVSWTQSHFVLAAKEESLSDQSESSNHSLPRRVSGEGGALLKRGVADGSSISSLPEPHQYLLSLSDIMDNKIKSKIFVISGAHRPESNRITAESIMVMVEGLLASGADTVLVPLWPSSHHGSRLMMNGFYSSLLYGSRTSRALAYAMQVAVHSQKHSHPSNWAGYMLFGKDIILKDRATDLSRSIRSMLQSPTDYLIAGLKTLQAMIVTSLKHLSQGITQSEPKVANRTTIESKLGSVSGWEELLGCNGFCFINPVKKDMPATIVFPEHDDSGLQKKTHKAIEALLGIPIPCLVSLSKLCKYPLVARPLFTAIKCSMAGLAASPRPDTAIEIQLERDVWDKEMCPEFFTNLHFNLMPTPSSSSSSCVVLSAPAKKLESKLLQFASNAIIAVFGPEEHMEVPPQKLAVYESELL
ncbi:PREDICTED: tetratricopeptide repeat protein 28 [Amphimedon queenslandica]|uniref:CHAT domain-containing protein n=1 Tax=Amphimedon queenslandica TaxID=400682 RepID=A0A1X7UPG5_AMPQE|nr:PREDICTED: tetratricopeptide repeat protein 28 [Amphimedon queenslandica]XP_019853011.1 PREDICTED: tetratricopeptide repeat protein 28 [Amphimedon queenslandica]|eukprot:XP_003387135.1 PREDICTED: tetratricopeptide repeat protein 28 [Amphimedon queenslandica]